MTCLQFSQTCFWTGYKILETQILRKPHMYSWSESYCKHLWIILTLKMWQITAADSAKCMWLLP